MQSVCSFDLSLEQYSSSLSANFRWLTSVAEMAVKFIVFAALLAIVKAGYLNGGIANNNNGGAGQHGSSNVGIVTAPLRYAPSISDGLSYTNSHNAPLTLNAGPAPSHAASVHTVAVAPALVIAAQPHPAPVATSSSYRHQISRSSASQVVAAVAPVVTSQIVTSHGAGLAGGYGEANGGGYNSGNNGGNNGGYGTGYDLHSH